MEPDRFSGKPKNADRLNLCIRQASHIHFPALKAIEIAAFQTLLAENAVSGEAVASSDEDLERYLSDSLLFGAFDQTGMPVGFAGGYFVENSLHIGEVNVHPDWQSMGVGRDLVRSLLEAGQAKAVECATLTTDRYVPFNARFYASLGFRILEFDACCERLARLLEAERTAGLDPVRRVAMRLNF